jgi:hypothetical protein
MQVDIGVLLPVSISLLLWPNIVLPPRLKGVEVVGSAGSGVDPGDCAQSDFLNATRIVIDAR